MPLNPGLTNGIVGVVDVDVTNGFNMPTYDYISLATASTTDTYTFKSGGSGGATVATITITYVDSSKATISTIAKT